MVILFAILMFGFLITIHEFGHYLFARIFKVGVKEFSVGMGPKILSHRSKKTKILYSLRLFPFGGYVSMVGEDESFSDEQEHVLAKERKDDEPVFTEKDALYKKPAWQRLIIMAAGGVFNIIVGVILCGVFVGMTTQSLGSTTIYDFKENATSQYYLEPGDEIVAVNGHSVGILSELSFRIMWEAETPTTAVVENKLGEKITLENVGLMDITLIRDGKKMLISDVPFSMATEQGIGMGQMDFQVYREYATFESVTRHTFCQARNNVNQIWASLGGLFTGRVNLSHMSGPVGITEQMTEAAGLGLEYLIYFAALIAINLGVFNLLPIPALDGGRIFFLLIETVRGKPISPDVEGKIHTVALVFLLALSVFVLFKDVFALFV